MTTPTFPYKVTLTREKAKVLARCLTYCIESNGIELSVEEVAWVASVCDRIDSKDLVERAIEARKPQHLAEIDNYLTKLRENEGRS